MQAGNNDVRAEQWNRRLSPRSRHLLPGLATVLLLVCVAGGPLHAQQAEGDVPEMRRAENSERQLQQLLSDAQRIARQLDELQEALSGELSSRQLNSARTFFAALIDEAQSRFANVQLTWHDDAASAQQYRTRLFAALRRQAADTDTVAALAELVKRAQDAMHLLVHQLDELQQAPHDPLRQQQLGLVKNKLDRVREIILATPKANEQSRWLDWASTNTVTSYSRGMLWFFLMVAAVATLYLLARWLISKRPQPTDAAVAIGGMAESVPLESPDQHRRLALEARAAADMRLALHHFQLMALSALDQARLVVLDHGRTNWELHAQLLRSRQNRLAAVLADMNRTYDRKWYGGELIAGQDVDDFARLADTLRQEVGHETI